MNRFFIILSLLVLFLLPTASFAGDDYTVLAPLPNTTSCGGNTGTACKADLSTYLPGMFNLTIGIAVVLAFMMISFGGFMYATSDAITKKSQGKEYITNALIGLGIVLGAWALLNTINPQILSFKLDLVSPLIPSENITSGTGVGAGGSPSAAGRPMTQDELNQSNTIRQRLLQNQVGTYRGPCTRGQVTGCVNLNGLTENTINTISSIRRDCNCVINITGGTEGGHTAGSSHANGTALDLQPTPSLAAFLAKTNAAAANPQGGRNPTVVRIGNTTFTYETAGDNGIATGAHWHVQF